MVDRIADIWGTRTTDGRGELWPVRVDQQLAEGIEEQDVERWVQAACTHCSNGCACDIAVKDGRMVGVRGRSQDTVNHGRLGPKGLFGTWQGVQSDQRLTTPLIRRGGELVSTDWDTAMGAIVQRSKALMAEKGPPSHGFSTSGQLFIEEYFALGIIGKAGLGTPLMDGDTRICTATAAQAMKDRLHVAAIEGTRGGPLGLLRDLRLLAQLVDTTYTLVKQAAAALHDEELLGVIRDCEGRTATQIAWIGTRMKQAAPQALVVAA